jgi:uncharacterized protein with PQ loop repeat
MDATELVGFCAMCLSGIKNVPQLYKIHTEDNVGSFSKHAILMAFIASLMWFYYGFKKNSHSLMIGSIGSILYEMYLLQKILKSEKNV